MSFGPKAKLVDIARLLDTLNPLTKFYNLQSVHSIHIHTHSWALDDRSAFWPISANRLIELRF